MPTTSSLYRPASLLAALAFTLATAACGSSSSDADAETDTATSDTESATSESSSEEEASGDESSGGESSGTVTISDGTVYELTDLSSCKTSSTDPSSYVIENGFDVSGWTADGEFRFYAGRAGLDEESVVFSAALEGDFDDEGKNEKMLYSIRKDTSDFVANGATVSGTFTMSAIGPTRPHGDDAEGTIEITCG